jgi:hypothetical protein
MTEMNISSQETVFQSLLHIRHQKPQKEAGPVATRQVDLINNKCRMRLPLQRSWEQWRLSCIGWRPS